MRILIILLHRVLRDPFASEAARMGDLGSQLGDSKSRGSLNGEVCDRAHMH